MAFAELLLVEVVLDLPNAVALLDFLHETQVVLAESFDDGVETTLAFTPRAFLGCGDQSEEGSAVFSGHEDGGWDRNDRI
jgi:hypothetical protein